MSAGSLRDSQLSMARYLRNPAAVAPPAGVEQRRLDIYARLVFNNIEGFVSKGFPVLRSLYEDDDWHRLVRGFIEAHPCRSPYFLEINQEFLQYLLEEYQPQAADPPFMGELAHYEWVELALDVADALPPPAVQVDDLLAVVLRLSPLAWLLCYRYPVHRVGPGRRPEAGAEPTYLLVYRDRQERVQFMELNAVTARLVELARDDTGATARELLNQLAAEGGMDAETVLESGAGQLQDLLERGVLAVSGSPAAAQS